MWQDFLQCRLIFTLHLCKPVGMHRLMALLPLHGGIFLAVLALIYPLDTLQAQPDSLANSTVLVIRHAEKPEQGSSLTAQGFARAQAYSSYFHPFHFEGSTLEIKSLFAASDQKKSMRPRLTLEPLSQVTGIALNTEFSSDDGQSIVNALRSSPHPQPVLIAWRHGHIPQLLRSFGANPETLLPQGKWQEDVYDLVIVLHFDDRGQLDRQTVVREPKLVP